MDLKSKRKAREEKLKRKVREEKEISFYRYAFHYAKKMSKGRDDAYELSEDFPPYAWEKKFCLQSHARMYQLWAEFLRQRFGYIGGHRNAAESAIRRRKTEQNRLLVVENIASADDDLRLCPIDLSAKNKMLLILRLEGFEWKEIADAFGLSKSWTWTASQELKEELRISEDLSEPLSRQLKNIPLTNLRERISERKASALTDLSSILEGYIS